MEGKSYQLFFMNFNMFIFLIIILLKKTESKWDYK